MRELPPDWQWRPLEELSAPGKRSITDGPFGSNLKTAHYTDSGPRVIRLQNIGDGVFVDERAHVSQAHYESLAKHAVEPGDLVIASLGKELPRSCVIPDWVPPAIVKADCVRVRLGPSTNVKYLNYYLNSQESRRYASGIIHGVGRPRLNLTEIRQLPIPIAPPDEQRRIVEAIETHLSHLNAGVESLQRAKRNIERMRAAILKAAVEGRLVPQNPDDEPAAVLLGRILDERRAAWEAAEVAKFEAKGRRPISDAWKSKYSVTECDGSSAPQLPSTWTFASLESITSPTRLIQYGILMPKENLVDGVPYVKVRDITDDGRIKLEQLHRTDPGIEEKYARSRLIGGDLLVSIRGTYGRVAVVPSELDGGNVTQDTARVALLDGVDPDYVELYLRSPVAQNFFRRVARGVAVKGVNIRDLRAAPVALPPLNEQGRIAATANEAVSLLTHMAQEVEASLRRSRSLRSAVLGAAFRGELTTSDPQKSSIRSLESEREGVSE